MTGPGPRTELALKSSAIISRCHTAQPHSDRALAVGSRALQHFSLIAQEVNRLLALGVPHGVDRSDLESEAQEALVVTVAKGARWVRLSIRHALQDLIRHEVMRRRFSGDMPSDVSTQSPSAESVVALVYDLSLRQVMAVRLVYYEGLTQEEAAEEMSCSQEDISHLLSRAIKKLRNSVLKCTV